MIFIIRILGTWIQMVVDTWIKSSENGVCKHKESALRELKISLKVLQRLNRLLGVIIA